MTDSVRRASASGLKVTEGGGPADADAAGQDKRGKDNNKRTPGLPFKVANNVHTLKKHNKAHELDTSPFARHRGRQYAP